MTGLHSPRVRLPVLLACLALMLASMLLASTGISEARPSPDAASSRLADNTRSGGAPAYNDPQQLSITFLRQLKYPGSDITIEQKLAPGVNYNRYPRSTI